MSRRSRTAAGSIERRDDGHHHLPVASDCCNDVTRSGRDWCAIPPDGVVLVPHTGFEPVISALRGRCPRPLDECGADSRRGHPAVPIGMIPATAGLLQRRPGPQARAGGRLGTCLAFPDGLVNRVVAAYRPLGRWRGWTGTACRAWMRRGGGSRRPHSGEDTAVNGGTSPGVHQRQATDAAGPLRVVRGIRGKRRAVRDHREWRGWRGAPGTGGKPRDDPRTPRRQRPTGQRPTRRRPAARYRRCVSRNPRIASATCWKLCSPMTRP